MLKLPPPPFPQRFGKEAPACVGGGDIAGGRVRDRLVVTATDNALFSTIRVEEVLPPLPPDSNYGG